MMIFLIPILIYIVYLVGTGIAYAVSNKKSPEPLEHRTQALELENFGQEWWDEFGTRCPCADCEKAKVERAKQDLYVRQREAEQALQQKIVERQIEVEAARLKSERDSRMGYKDGYSFQYPQDVPLNAHVEVEGNKNFRNNFASIHLRWTDTDSGKQMGMRITGTRHQGPVKIDSAGALVPLVLRANEIRQLSGKPEIRLGGFIDYDTALFRYKHNVKYSMEHHPSLDKDSHKV
jgi:hypothetical protein